MAQPYNYTLNVESPFNAAVQGYQAGAMIRNDQQQQQLLQQQQQAAQLLKQQQQEDFSRVVNNPNASPREFAALTLKYPTFKDQFKQASEMMTADQKANTLKTGTQVYAALSNNAPDVAKQLLMNQAQAKRNSGDEQGAKQDEAIAGTIDVNPTLARNMIGIGLSAMDDKFASNVSTLNTDARASAEAPADLAIKNATAGIKSTEAAAAPAKAQADLANTQSQIEDRKAGQRIAELNTQISQANSETQRGQLVLERDKLMQAQADKATSSGAEQQTQLDSAQQAIDTANGILRDPLLNSSVGVGSVIGKALSFIPGTENKDFRAKVDTLKAQLFIPAVGQLKAAGGGGALSDAEGKRLDASIASLDADQSPAAFKNNLGVVTKLLEKMQQKVLANKNTPTSGGGFVETIPGIGRVNEGDVNRLLKQFPGTTREQVMQYLNSQKRGGATGAY